jgi:hypothetical protein
MRIAIGDVVRVKSDQALGTVVCVTRSGRGSVVHLHTDGLGSRVVSPEDLEHVARIYKPTTPGRSIVTLLLLALGLVIAVSNGLTLHNLGAGILLTAFVTVTSLTTVSAFLITLVNRPRPVRV